MGNNIKSDADIVILRITYNFFKSVEKIMFLSACFYFASSGKDTAVSLIFYKNYVIATLNTVFPVPTIVFKKIKEGFFIFDKHSIISS